MNGWRFWIVVRGRLVSPSFALESWFIPRQSEERESRCTLPDDGMLHAYCEKVGFSAYPHAGCDCGVYFAFPEHAEPLLAMARTLRNVAATGGRTPCAIALTYGTATGPFLRDPLEPRFGVRARSFRVRAILVADGHEDGLDRYDVPLYKGALNSRSMRQIERELNSTTQAVIEKWACLGKSANVQ